MTFSRSFWASSTGCPLTIKPRRAFSFQAKIRAAQALVLPIAFNNQHGLPRLPGLERLLIIKQRIGRGDRQNRVVGEMRILPEQGKILAAVIVELVHRADDFTYEYANDVRRFQGKW